MLTRYWKEEHCPCNVRAPQWAAVRSDPHLVSPAPAFYCCIVQSTAQPALESDHLHLSEPRWSGREVERSPSAQLNTWNYCFTPSWTCRAWASSAKPSSASCPNTQVVLQWGDHGHWDWPLASPCSSQYQTNLPPVHIHFQLKRV